MIHWKRSNSWLDFTTWIWILYLNFSLSTSLCSAVFGVLRQTRTALKTADFPFGQCLLPEKLFWSWCLFRKTLSCDCCETLWDIKTLSVNWVKKTIQTECPKTSKSPCLSIETMMLSVGPLNFEVHIYYTYIKREKRNGIYILWISLLHVIIKEERESFI